MPDLEGPAQPHCDLEFGGEKVLFRYLWARGGCGGDEAVDGGVVVFCFGREVEDRQEEFLRMQSESRCGEVETVEEGQRCCLSCAHC